MTSQLTVVVGHPALLQFRQDLEERLPDGCVTRWHSGADEAALLADLRDADVFVGSVFTAAMGSAAPKLRLVQAAAAGYDGIDLAALPPGAVCANAYGHDDSIAEYIAAATVLVRRRLLVQDHEMRRGHWATSRYEPDFPEIRTLQDALIGFVGFGRIGARAWTLLRAFGARGAAVTRRPVDAAAHGLAWAGGLDQLDELLSSSDVVVLSVPLSELTRGMIGAAELAAMKADAVLVNVGRGQVVDQHALYAALKEGRLAGAALDVWYRYPEAGSHGEPADEPFADLPNVLMTPHVAGGTRQTITARLDEVAANVRRLIAGEPLVNVVASAAP